MFDTAFLDVPPLLSAGGTVRLPGSKSISNRVLLLAALSEGVTTVHDVLSSDDTHVMLEALRALGCGVDTVDVLDTDASSAGVPALRITGLGTRLPHSPTALFLGNAGTAMRPLVAALALLGGEFTLSGVARMHERPIGDLVDALRQLGCHIDYVGHEGFPPLRIAHGAGRPALQVHAPIQVRGDVSSQFLTALLMALPLVASAHDVVIEVVGELISKPYIHITLQLLARFGITVQHENWQRFTIPAGSCYRSPGSIHVESDASSASYFIALGALSTGYNDTNGTNGTRGITIEGLGHDCIQGDIRFVEAARAMGAHITSGPHWLHIERGAWPLQAVDLDCNHIPDAAMTLAVMALYAQGTTVLRNIASWRVKETDRIAAMGCELRKLGATVEEGADYIRITPPATVQDWRAASIHTYDDHRIAMCFALAAFNPAQQIVRIEDPKCVAKTFPDYFETLFTVVQTSPQHLPIVCIDGPTASGKGTVAAAVARQLGYVFLDSGALYRLAALAALRAGLTITEVNETSAANETALAKIAEDLPVRFEQDRIWLADEDVTDTIRSEEMGNLASRLSSLGAVRAALFALQHRFARLPGLVADGRDMGSIIFPHAALKVFLTADSLSRAERRHKQLIEKGISANMAALRSDLEARDARDKNRAVAPLEPAQDALLLDNSELSVEQTIAQVLSWWHARRPFALDA